MKRFIIECPTGSDARRVTDFMHKKYRFDSIPIEVSGKFLTFDTDKEDFVKTMKMNFIQWCYSFTTDVDNDNIYVATLRHTRGTDEYEPAYRIQTEGSVPHFGTSI